MPTITNTKQIDPVCGMEVDPAASSITTCYDGKKIFFCAEGCKKTFETNPRTYIIAHRKGFWRRYLDRLEKATGGKPMSCH